MSVSLDILPETAFAFFLIFARIGAMVMVLPALGEQAVPPQARLVLAMGLTLVLMPVLTPGLPPLPDAFGPLVAGFLREILIGLVLGFSIRLILVGLQIAAANIAMQSGLAMAQAFDPAEGRPSTVFEVFLSLLAIVLIFASDLHHLLIAALFDSYAMFPPGAALPTGDLAELAIGRLSAGFLLAVQLSAPFMVFGLVFNAGIGILSKLIPQVQVYFVVMSANVFLTMALFLLVLSGMMIVYIQYFEGAVQPFLAR